LADTHGIAKYARTYIRDTFIDVPIGFPINNIISHTGYTHTSTHTKKEKRKGKKKKREGDGF